MLYGKGVSSIVHLIILFIAGIAIGNDIDHHQAHFCGTAVNMEALKDDISPEVFN